MLFRILQATSLLLLASAAAVLPAELIAQQSSFGGGQTGTQPDCTNPLSASDPQCAAKQSQSIAPRGQGSSTSTWTFGQRPGDLGSYNDMQAQANNGRAGAGAELAPEPLTEFQKFIASTSGQVLPIFGADLFRRVPSTFSPLDMAPVPQGYILGPDDELRIRAWGQVNFQANVTVDRAGDIYLPQVGPVHVAGLEFSALDGHLRAAIGRVYRNFDLTVDVGQIRAIQVYVTGQARRPGVYTVSSLSTLVDALFASGGPAVEGSLRHIELRRAGKTVTEFDLYGLLLGGDKSKDVKLLPADVIYIPPAGALAAVTGSVRKPGIYEVLENEPLSELLTHAGGANSISEAGRVSIERMDSHHDRQAMEVAYDTTGLGTPMKGGDLVRVYSILPAYRKTVTLRGNLANPGRFSWHEGMKVSELIPDKESLLTRNYWWKRAQLGFPAPEFEPVPGFSQLRQPLDNTPMTLDRSEIETANLQNRPGIQQAEKRSRRTEISAQHGVMPGQPVAGPQSGTPEEMQRTGSLEGPGQGAGQASGQGQGIEPERNPGGAQTNSELLLAAEQGVAPVRMPIHSPRTEVQLHAAELDWNYAVVERLDKETLKTVLLPFDLGKLVLEHDATQDLALEAGDVVSIFSQDDIRVPAAQQTKLVRMEGEIAHAGYYSVKPGETLRQVVERAGGLTDKAYLFGSQFYRESSRAAQQERIDQYVQKLDMDIQRGNLAVAASAASSTVPGANAEGGAAASEQAILARLKEIHATGRLVLGFTPNSAGLGSIPDIELEDGDRLVVPPVPANVNVVGAVYDQNSFLFAARRRVGSYLQQAGGPNRDADRRHMFIIRANGSVAARAIQNGLWDSSFNNLAINPGDTIVVPEKTFRPAAMRNFIEWSQLFSQLALGSAAISILK
ncbi:MAG: SLBB domain-containing protein [Terracidiphilus sp.]